MSLGTVGNYALDHLEILSSRFGRKIVSKISLVNMWSDSKTEAFMIFRGFAEKLYGGILKVRTIE